MLYKEWRRTRLKFGLMLALYAFAGLLVNTLFAPDLYDFSGHSVFQYWVVAAISVSMGAGVLGGVDAIAEENDKGTIGFLLSRPVSRLKVYSIKILLNSLALAVALAITSLVIFFTQLIPRFHNGYFYDQETGTGYPATLPNPFIPPQEALSDIVAIMALGVMLICLSTLVSVFARTTIQAIVWTFLLMLVSCFVTYGFFTFLGGSRNFTIDEPTIFHQFYEASLPIFVVLAVFTTLIYLLGLNLFKRKEF